jgi:hypothetical protein
VLFVAAAEGSYAQSASTPVSLGARPAIDAGASIIERQYDNALRQVPSWETAADILLLLTILIALFGATVAALQGWEAVASKIIVEILGIAITVFTAIEKTVFEHDYRTYNERLDEAKVLQDKIDLELSNLKENPSDGELAAAAQEDLLQDVVKFEQLGSGLRRIPWWLLWLTSARANDAINKNEGMIKGRGVGPTLAIAEKRAYEGVVRLARETVEGLVKTRFDKLPKQYMCVLENQRDNIIVDIAQQFSGFREPATVSRKEASGTYSVDVSERLNIEFIDSSTQVALENYFESYVETNSVPEKCQFETKLEGNYAGTWQSDKYEIGGEASVILTNSGNGKLLAEFKISGSPVEYNEGKLEGSYHEIREGV